MTLEQRVADDLAAGERIVACMPFAAVPKFPGRVRRKEKIRTGLRQSWRRYRPLVFTNRRLFVFDSGRTPNPRELLATFPISSVELRELRPGGFGGQLLVLHLPGHGDVPFELGRKDLADLPALDALLNPTSSAISRAMTGRR